MAPSTGGKTPEQGDLDGDGDVDFADFSILSGNFTGTIAGPPSELPLKPGRTAGQVSYIPEPATAGMLIVGLMPAWQRRNVAAAQHG